LSPRARAAWTAGLLLFGTFLAWSVFVEPAPRALFGLLLAGLGVFAWWHRSPGHTTHLALIAGAGLLSALSGPLASPRPGAAALFSSLGGLFFWSPVLWLGVAGLVLLGRRLRERALVLALSAAVFMIVGAAWPEPRVSPGAPRWAPLLAFLAPGVAEALRGLAQVGRRRPGLVLTALGALAVLSNVLLMHQYRAGLVPRDDTVSFPQVAESSARLMSESVGAPLAWPANWIFARREGLPVGRTDLLLGADVRGAGIDIGALDQDAALLFEGWSVRRLCAPEICREVEGRARLLAPLGAPETLDVSVRAAGAGALTVELNGVPIARQELTNGLRPFTVRVPAARFRAPLNEIVLVVSPGGRALVDRLAFSRPSA
jgi:hypothetical protein